ncbi:hypothetical protein MRX96_002305 [Rhipicephalus microplus]
MSRPQSFQPNSALVDRFSAAAGTSEVICATAAPTERSADTCSQLASAVLLLPSLLAPPLPSSWYVYQGQSWMSCRNASPVVTSLLHRSVVVTAITEASETSFVLFQLVLFFYYH